MSDDEIKDIDSLKKLSRDAEQFAAFKKLWPSVKPVAKMLGIDTGKVDDQLNKIPDLDKQIQELVTAPDKFNDLFIDIGWVFFDSLELEVALEAIKIAEETGIEEADLYLTDHFSPDWVEKRLMQLKHAEGFQARFTMAEAALQDYKSGRYYASVLLTLTLVDGWVNDLNIVDFQRHGFFSEKSELVAWDSITAHPKGLMRLRDVFAKPRQSTRTETITIPYRHGIMHGMDLGYNNKFVAAKCWAALFAVREWAIKVAKGELKPPEPQEESETALQEIFESIRKTQKKKELMETWQPRQVIVGESVPSTGTEEAYPVNTPERKLVEFLNYWLKKNYGYMAGCYTSMFQMKPVNMRESFENKKLLEFEILNINDKTATTTDIQVRVRLDIDTYIETAIYEFRIVCSEKNGDLAYIQSEDTVWGLGMWKKVS